MRTLITDHRLLITLPLVLLLAGCASPEKRFARGAAAQSRGDHAEAVEQYAKVLRKQPDFPGAAANLAAAGDAYWQDAQRRLAAANRADDPATRAEIYLDASRTFARFHQTSVAPPTPSDFDAALEAACRDGRQRLLATADNAVRAGNWRPAETALRRADRLARTPADRQTIDDAWTALYLAQTEQALAKNKLRDAESYLANAERKLAVNSPHAQRFHVLSQQLTTRRLNETAVSIRTAIKKRQHQTAWDVADKTLRDLGPNHPRSAEFADLRRRAAVAGRITVAYVPFWVTPATAKQLPTGWLNELNSHANRHHWQQPDSPFIAPVPVTTVATTMRQLDYHRRQLSPEQLTIIGQRLKADLVLYGEISAFTTTPYAATLQLQLIDVAKARRTKNHTITTNIDTTPATTPRTAENQLFDKLLRQTATAASPMLRR